MANKILLAIEAMTLGVKAMADHATEHGYVLELLTEDASIYSDKGNTKVTHFPTRDSKALDAYIQENRDKIAGVFSSTDTWGVAAAELREKYGFPSRITPQKLKLLRDKQWVHNKLYGAASKTPYSYPKIAKPRGGTGSCDIHLLNNQEDYDRFCSNVEATEDYLLQPYHQGPLYSAECWSDGETFLFFGVTNRILTAPPVFLEQVKSFPHACNSKWEDKVQAWSKDVMSKLDYDIGLAHIEFIETKNGFELVELNARMAGALITPSIEACTNYDPYLLTVLDALNIKPNPPKERIVTSGYSHVSLYAEQTGILKSVTGADLLSNYPGQAHWHPSKDLGAQITETSTYRARIGNVSAMGSCAAIAQDRAIAAASVMKVCIE